MNDSADETFPQRMQHLETLIQRAEAFPDATAREMTRKIVQILMDLHGAGLGRIVQVLSEAGTTGQGLLNRLANDEMVATLLLLYGLHPQDLASRVRLALDEIGPFVATHGCSLELIEVSEGVVRMRLERNNGSYPPPMLRSALEEALLTAAPDLVALEIEGMPEPPLPISTRLALPLVGAP